MRSEAKALGYLGLASRAGKVESGEFSAEKAIKSHRACVVVIAEDASDNTGKKFHQMCEYRNVPCIGFSDRETLGRAIGKGFRAVCAVTDRKLAEAFIRSVQE